MEILQLIRSCQEKINNLEELVPINKLLLRLEELDKQTSQPNIWKDPKLAGLLMKERQKVSELINKFRYF